MPPPIPRRRQPAAGVARPPLPHYHAPVSCERARRTACRTVIFRPAAGPLSKDDNSHEEAFMKIILIHSDEGWSVSVPSLPGCCFPGKHGGRSHRQHQGRRTGVSRRQGRPGGKGTAGRGRSPTHRDHRIAVPKIQGIDHRRAVRPATDGGLLRRTRRQARHHDGWPSRPGHSQDRPRQRLHHGQHCRERGTDRRRIPRPAVPRLPPAPPDSRHRPRLRRSITESPMPASPVSRPP